MWEIEDENYAAGFQTICGVDEAGRGPLAGPVCAAAVILPKDLDLEAELPGLNDSKKLTDARRRVLFDKIKSVAVSYGIAFATHQEIDEVNILQATFLAMGRAVSQLSQKPELALVGGNEEAAVEVPVKAIVKGDSLSANSAAASILAKVTRDDYMMEMAKEYPGYGFEIHKGYPTKAHYAALDEHGECPIHRQSFLRKYHAQRNGKQALGRLGRIRCGGLSA